MVATIMKKLRGSKSLQPTNLDISDFRVDEEFWW